MEFNVFRSWVYARRGSKFPKSFFQKLIVLLSSRHNRFSRYLHQRIDDHFDKKEFRFHDREFRKEDWLLKAKGIIDQYDAYLASRDDKVDFRLNPIIIVTDVPIADGFFSLTNGPIGLVSTANWKYYFKPASTLDYVLASTQRLALRMTFNSQIGSHFETKGCVWDYCQYQPDARISIFNGYICEKCSRKLAEAGLTDENIDKLQLLTSNKWLGSKSDQYSVSGILSKNYKYDLSRSTGPSGDLFTALLDALRAESAEILRTSLRWSIIIGLTLLITTRFPSVIALYKSVKESLAQ